jgi:hypothetical protein
MKVFVSCTKKKIVVCNPILQLENVICNLKVVAKDIFKTKISFNEQFFFYHYHIFVVMPLNVKTFLTRMFKVYLYP